VSSNGPNGNAVATPSVIKARFPIGTKPVSRSVRYQA